MTMFPVRYHTVREQEENRLTGETLVKQRQKKDISNHSLGNVQRFESHRTTYRALVLFVLGLLCDMTTLSIIATGATKNALNSYIKDLSFFFNYQPIFH